MSVWYATGLLLLALLWVSPAWAGGTQFPGNCSTISWTANTEPDLAGYRIYDRVNQTSDPTLILTVGSQITSVSCATLNLNPGQHYLSISSFDTSGNESVPSAEIPFVLYVANTITNLAVTIVNATDVTLSFTEVDGGNGLPASYDVRFSVSPITWGTAASVSAGTCSTPLAGTAIGATKTCTVTGLAATTAYQFQLVPFRGTLDVDAVYGPLSNIASATTGGSPPPATNRALLVLDDFSRGNGALPNPPWMNGYTSWLALMELSTDVANNASQNALGIYNPATIAFEANQWAEMRVDSFAAGTQQTMQLALRFPSPPTVSGYTCLIRRNGTYTSSIRLYTDGASTTLVSENATTWAATDTWRCEVHTTGTGNLIELYRNTSSTPLLSYLDTASTYASGQPGILINSGTTPGGDNWSAGNFVPEAGADICGCDEH